LSLCLNTIRTQAIIVETIIEIGSFVMKHIIGIVMPIEIDLIVPPFLAV